MTLTHNLHDRRVIVSNGLQGRDGTIRGVCYGDNEAGVTLWIEFDNGKLGFVSAMSVRLVADSPVAGR